MDFSAFRTFSGARFPFIDAVQWQRFEALEDLYRTWNARINVISRRDMDGLYDHHVLHSLSIAAFLQAREPAVFDR